MELGLVVLKQAASFRNQGDLIHKAAKRLGWGVTYIDLNTACVGPPKGRWDKVIALVPLWPLYLFSVLRLVAWSSRTHVIYGPVDGPFQRNLNLFNVMQSMRIVAPSKWCAEQITKSAGVPCGVVHHGIDHKDFEFTEKRIKAQRQIWLRDKGERTILFSNLNPLHRKGFPHLCKAIVMLRKKLGDTFLMVLHTGLKEARKLTPDLENTPGLILEDSFNTLPFRAIALKTAACDVYVHPALQEGFGLPLLEAMAAQKTIVSLDAPAMNELVTDKEGWLFPMSHLKKEAWKNGAIAYLHEYEPSMLADAMEDAIVHKEQSLKKAEEAYTKSLQYDYLKRYKELVAY